MSPKSFKFYCMLYHLWSCFVLRLSFSGRPVEINLCRLTQFIFVSKSFDALGDCIYADLSKAFNRLDHFKLLNKLHIFGLSYALIKRIQNLWLCLTASFCCKNVRRFSWSEVSFNESSLFKASGFVIRNSKNFQHCCTLLCLYFYLWGLYLCWV